MEVHATRLRGPFIGLAIWAVCLISAECTRCIRNVSTKMFRILVRKIMTSLYPFSDVLAKYQNIWRLADGLLAMGLVAGVDRVLKSTQWEHAEWGLGVPSIRNTGIFPGFGAATCAMSRFSDVTMRSSIFTDWAGRLCSCVHLSLLIVYHWCGYGNFLLVIIRKLDIATNSTNGALAGVSQPLFLQLSLLRAREMIGNLPI